MQTPDATELELRTLSVTQTTPLPVECLLCYVRRMLDAFGCNATLRWARRWRDMRAPRATALEGRLARGGGFCDCEIFLNGWILAGRVSEDEPEHLEDGHAEFGLAATAGEPPCVGVRRGSSQPCELWVRRPQPWRR